MSTTNSTNEPPKPQGCEHCCPCGCHKPSNWWPQPIVPYVVPTPWYDPNITWTITSSGNS